MQRRASDQKSGMIPLGQTVRTNDYRVIPGLVPKATNEQIAFIVDLTARLQDLNYLRMRGESGVDDSIRELCSKAIELCALRESVAYRGGMEFVMRGMGELSVTDEDELNYEIYCRVRDRLATHDMAVNIPLDQPAPVHPDCHCEPIPLVEP
jgi:hypothetical protein